ncbi:MAG: hypothetical protein ACRDJ2_16895 [Actinomycetota bacterium]
MSRSLLDQIEQDALNSDVNLADVLRKCIALGGHAGSEGVRAWAMPLSRLGRRQMHPDQPGSGLRLCACREGSAFIRSFPWRGR